MVDRRSRQSLGMILAVLLSAFAGIGAELFWLSDIRQSREAQAEEPVILYVAPPAIRAGETTSLLVRGDGTGFTPETVAWFDGVGVTVVERECLSPERLLLKVLADANLPVGSLTLNIEIARRPEVVTLKYAITLGEVTPNVTFQWNNLEQEGAPPPAASDVPLTPEEILEARERVAVGQAKTPETGNESMIFDFSVSDVELPVVVEYFNRTTTGWGSLMLETWDQDWVGVFLAEGRNIVDFIVTDAAGKQGFFRQAAIRDSSLRAAADGALEKDLVGSPDSPLVGLASALGKFLYAGNPVTLFYKTWVGTDDGFIIGEQVKWCELYPSCSIIDEALSIPGAAAPKTTEALLLGWENVQRPLVGPNGEGHPVDGEFAENAACGGAGPMAGAAGGGESGIFTPHPVNLKTGEKIEVAEDALSLGAAFNVVFKRIYRSQFQYNGVLGKNWDFNYNEHVGFYGSGGNTYYCVYYHMGQKHEYKSTDGGSTWSSPENEGFFDKLTLNANNDRVEIKKSTGLVIWFDRATGKLKRYQDRNGNYVSFEYDTSNRLTLAKESLGGAGLSFAYEGSPSRITSVSQNAGGYWSFQYDSNGRLTKVYPASASYRTEAEQSSTSRYMEYLYDISNQRTILTEVKDYRGHTQKKIEYSFINSQPRVVKQYLYGATTVSMEYDYDFDNGEVTYTDRDGVQHAFYFDPENRVTKLRSKLDVAQEARETMIEYGLENCSSACTGCPLVCKCKYGPSASGTLHTVSYVYDPNGRLSKYTIEGPSNLTWEYQYQKTNDVVYLTYMKDPMDRVTRFTYDGNGNLVTITAPQEGDQYQHEIYEYRSNGLLTKIRLRDSNQIRFTYSGVLSTYLSYALTGISRTDSVGTVALFTTLSYDTIRLPTQVTAGGISTGYSYDGLKLVTKLTRYPNVGNVQRYVTKYSYDGNMNLVTGELTTEYTSGGPTTEGLSFFKYSNADLVTKSSRKINSTPTWAESIYTYNDNDRVTQVQHPNGAKTGYAYNSYGQLTKTTLGKDATEESWIKYAYDLRGMLTWVGSGKNQTTLTEERKAYDAYGRLTRSETGTEVGDDGESNFVKLAYDRSLLTRREAGKEVNGSDTVQMKTMLAYDGRNRMTREDRYTNIGTSAYLATVYGYDDADKLTKTEYGSGQTWRTTNYEFDSAGRVTLASLPQAHDNYRDEMEFVYSGANLLSRRVYEAHSGGRVTYYSAYTYDGCGRVATADSFSGVSDLNYYWYDSRDNLYSKMDENGVSSLYDYDMASRLIAVTLADGTSDEVVNEIKYDNSGNLTTRIDGRGVSTEYRRDALGRVTLLIHSANQMLPSSTVYTYDGASRIFSIVDSRSEKIVFFFDSASRLLSRTYGTQGGSLPGERRADFLYDGLFLTKAENYSDTGAQNRISTVTIGYDALGRPSSETLNIAEMGRGNKTVNYEYDGVFGDLTKLSYSAPINGESATEATYSYTALAQLSTVSVKTFDWANPKALADYDYQGLAKIRQRVVTPFENSTSNLKYTTQCTFDTAGRETTRYNFMRWFENGAFVSDVSQFVNVWGDGGSGSPFLSRVSEENLTVSGQLDTFVPDDLYRLARWTRDPSGSNERTTFDYDDANNRTTVTKVTGQGQPTTEVYTINTDNQYTQIGATNLGWNSAGFLTSYGSKSYTWDLLYRLATFDASAGANDDYVYKYDAFGCARQAQELMGCESPTR